MGLLRVYLIWLASIGRTRIRRPELYGTRQVIDQKRSEMRRQFNATLSRNFLLNYAEVSRIEKCAVAVTHMSALYKVNCEPSTIAL